MFYVVILHSYHPHQQALIAKKKSSFLVLVWAFFSLEDELMHNNKYPIDALFVEKFDIEMLHSHNRRLESI
jgi:hypothetical protein